MANEKRLIDANEVERKIKIAISSWQRDCNSNAPVIARAMEDALQRVIYAPTVDAVEVVWCKDCRQSEKWGGQLFCRRWGADWHAVSENAFCYYGERREGK